MGTSSLGYDTGLKVPPTIGEVRAGTSSLGCGTGLKVPPTIEALPRIPPGKKKNNYLKHPFAIRL